MEDGFVDHRRFVRRQDDLTVDQAISTIAKIQKVLVVGAIAVTFFVGLLAWVGWTQRSPAQSMDELRSEIATIRSEGMQRDTLIRNVVRSVALLTYYRCNDENQKHVTGVPVDCAKLLQDNER